MREICQNVFVIIKKRVKTVKTTPGNVSQYLRMLVIIIV